MDPYCTIRFAGHKQKTKIIENRSYPDWNTELKLNVLVCGQANCINITMIMLFLIVSFFE